MSWLFGENWLWLLLSALLGAAVTLFYVLRKVTVSTVSSRTVSAGLPDVDVDGPSVGLPDVAVPAVGAAAGLGAAAMSGALPDLDLPSADLPSVDVPDLDLPSVDLPSVDVPDLDVPSVDVPDVALPAAAGLGALGLSADLPEADLPSVESLDVPELDLDLPEADLPSVESLDVPEEGLPEADLLSVESLDVPDVDVPAVDADMPAVEAPEVEGGGALAGAVGLAAAGAFVAGPYAGSAAANADRSQPAGYSIKGNADSMLYHTSESPYYGRTIAEVWFDSEDSARGAGFTRWDERKRESAEPVGFAAVPAAGAFGAGSADPLEGGASPHESFTIKGNADSMLYHTTESPYYGRTIAEVWFDSEDSARNAGFRRWDDRG